ncbi:pentatricopeptide repeat-containing protein At1g09190 [Prosopis cineraria]|uniref:pentatricopeptide repeat-containing protein At1g09190 n=1 Tax=Prosopis cineraria TaxID=364024 RepID=UPI00240F8FED|nr:pentatricopeptide repeat-containing protein At1g09190 [Prosopis cineraria]
MSRSCREIERKVLRLLHGHNTRTQITQIHAHFLRHALHHSNQILAHFVSVCTALDQMSYATRIFYQTRNPNVLLFNSMIKGFSLCAPFQQSFHFFSLMRAWSILPDEYTFTPLLKSTSNLCDYKLGQCVHAHLIQVGFEGHGSIRIGLVELYTTCERMGDAGKVFDPMFDTEVIVWNLMIRGFCKTGCLEIGFKLFRQMKEHGIVSWNIMISSLAQNKKDREALELFHEMLELGFKPDDATLVTVLPVCARLGALDAGKWIYSYACSRGFQRDVPAVGNSLVDFYCKSGNLEVAWSIFNEMPRKNVVSWNAMISGLAYNGKGELGLDLFQEMMKKGVSPSDSTFTSILACCAHAGLADRGLELFASVTAKFQLQPKLEHYGCVVDLLGRCGQLWEAHDLIRSMPMKPTAALWGALLSACRTYGERKLAEIAVKELINLEPWNSGNYVLLSNIYAEEGKWDKVEKVRLVMQENSIRKTPGQSATG